jgi:hypothetical protein
MGFLLVLAVCIIFTLLCVSMAKTRRRNVVLWGVMGFSFWFIPVIILALIGPAPE